jgi:hypothetical protein
MDGNVRRTNSASANIVLTNKNLEDTPALHPLIDGIDSTLIDLASEEITEERLVQLAVELADQTFAAQNANPLSQAVLRTVFQLRATRVANTQTAGRLGWIRETGARMRMIETVEPRRGRTAVAPVGLTKTRTPLVHCLVENAVIHESIVKWAADRP